MTGAELAQRVHCLGKRPSVFVHPSRLGQHAADGEADRHDGDADQEGDPQHHGAQEVNEVRGRMQRYFMRRFGIEDLVSVRTTEAPAD